MEAKIESREDSLRQRVKDAVKRMSENQDSLETLQVKEPSWFYKQILSKTLKEDEEDV